MTNEMDYKKGETSMANLLLRHVYKIYPGVGKAKKNAKGEAKKRSGDFVAVKDFNMEIEDGEFIIEGEFRKPNIMSESLKRRLIQYGVPQDELNVFLKESDRG